MARRAQRNFTRSGPRPNRDWSANIDVAYQVLAANTKVLHSVFVPTNPGIDFTLLRTVGHISVASDQTAAVEQQMGAFGMILVTDSAVAIGVTAMPDTVTDAGDDWFVYQAFTQQGANGTDGVGSTQYAFDSKAKRIFNGTGINIALIVVNGHATHGLEFAIQLRLLAQVRGTR